MSERTIIPSFDLYKTIDPFPGMELSKLEESYNPYDTSLAHRHNYYEILFFRGSGGTHEIDFHAYPVKENTMHFISPDQVHLLRCDKDVTGYVLAFVPEFWYGKNPVDSLTDSFPFFNHPVTSPVVTIEGDEQQHLVMGIIANIAAEYASMHNDKTDVLLSYLTILLIAARRLYASNPVSAKTFNMRSGLVQQFKKAIAKDFRQQKSVAHYATLLNITAGHLGETVQNDTGKTALGMIHDRVILEAKRLLYHSSKSVKEIAFELGYEDPSYFARFFKTHTQTTPEIFRSEIRKKYQ